MIITIDPGIKELLIAIGGTVIGGLLFGLIIYIFNQYIFPKPELSGEWISEEIIENASRNALKGYKLVFKIHLLQRDLELEGTGEKIMEIPPDGTEVRYEVVKRVHIDIKGTIKRNYLGKSKINILIHEDGRLRPSSTTFELKILDSSTLSGSFSSTAANANGRVVLKRNNGQNN